MTAQKTKQKASCEPMLPVRSLSSPPLSPPHGALTSESVHVDDECNRHGNPIREGQGGYDSADLAPRDGVAVCDSVANIRRCHHDFSRGGLLPRYELAFAQRSGRNAFFQSGMAEIFFSRRRTSASRCKLGTRSEGKLGLTSTRASALAKDSRDML